MLYLFFCIFVAILLTPQQTKRIGGLWVGLKDIGLFNTYAESEFYTYYFSIFCIVFVLFLTYMAWFKVFLACIIYYNPKYLLGLPHMEYVYPFRALCMRIFCGGYPFNAVYGGVWRKYYATGWPLHCVISRLIMTWLETIAFLSAPLLVVSPLLTSPLQTFMLPLSSPLQAVIVTLI